MSYLEAVFCAKLRVRGRAQLNYQVKVGRLDFRSLCPKRAIARIIVAISFQSYMRYWPTSLCVAAYGGGHII